MNPPANLPRFFDGASLTLVDVGHAGLAPHEASALERLVMLFLARVDSNIRIQRLLRFSLRISKIDIVAGTMTTLVYELLPAGKIIWYLDTPYRHLQDLVQEGLAHLIRLKDIQAPVHMPVVLTNGTSIHVADLFSEKGLCEVLQVNFSSRLAQDNCPPAS